MCPSSGSFKVELCKNSVRVVSHLTSLSIKAVINNLRKNMYFSRFKASF